jgi:hypothetical protein
MLKAVDYKKTLRQYLGIPAPRFLHEPREFQQRPVIGREKVIVISKQDRARQEWANLWK